MILGITPASALTFAVLLGAHFAASRWGERPRNAPVFPRLNAKTPAGGRRAGVFTRESAATYSPTGLPRQYHPRSRA